MVFPAQLSWPTLFTLDWIGKQWRTSTLYAFTLLPDFRNLHLRILSSLDRSILILGRIKREGCAVTLRCGIEFKYWCTSVSKHGSSARFVGSLCKVHSIGYLAELGSCCATYEQFAFLIDIFTFIISVYCSTIVRKCRSASVSVLKNRVYSLFDSRFKFVVPFQNQSEFRKTRSRLIVVCVHYKYRNLISKIRLVRKCIRVVVKSALSKRKDGLCSYIIYFFMLPNQRM